jgi:hypothetical protein
MKVLSTFIALTAITASAVSAIELAPRSNRPRVVSLDVERRKAVDDSTYSRSGVFKRSGTVSETLDNEETLYFANITLGTPAQSLRLHIDTGSSDLWVNVANSSLCSSGRQTSCIGGIFEPDSSSTLKIVNNDFNISYVDGSSATGDYVTDTLVFGGVSLSDFQFGLGETSASYEGVLGIGYMSNEVQVQRAGGAKYPNLPQALVNGGLISRSAYSLWLNDLDASTGTILFGGVNTAKYTGELATLPVLSTYGGYYELSVALTGVGINGSSISSSSLPVGAVLDSGTTLTYLPDDVADAIFTKVGATYNDQEGAAYAACDLADQDATIDFTFSGRTISVAFDELIFDYCQSDGSQLKFENGQTACIFGIAPAEGTTPVLGDTFLRSAYVVYDLSNNEISLAQTVFNTTADDVREIASGTALVPGATLISSAVSSVAAGTSAAKVGGVATATASVKNDSPSTLMSFQQSSMAVIGVVIVSMLVGAGIISF